jgi:hypothetical protein
MRGITKSILNMHIRKSYRPSLITAWVQGINMINVIVIYTKVYQTWCNVELYPWEASVVIRGSFIIYVRPGSKLNKKRALQEKEDLKTESKLRRVDQ